MCFSATASFSAAAFLSIVGALNLKKMNQNNQFFLAVVPFIFAIQQLSEGFLWLAHQNPAEFAGYANLEKYIFLFIAILLWPIWIPLSLYAIEKDPTRKKWLLAILCLGVASSIFLAVTQVFFNPNFHLGAHITNHSIQYDLPFEYSNVLIAIYILATIITPFISSIKNMWKFGLGIGLGFILAEYLYSTTFVSVWCFFAAIISIGIYFLFKSHVVSNETKAFEKISNH